MRLRVRRVSVIGLPSESRVRVLLGGFLVLGGIMVFLAYFYLAEGGGVNVSKRGVHLSPPMIFCAQHLAT